MAALVLVPACQGCFEEQWSSREANRDLVEVREASIAIETGRVGHDRWETSATYVLVDAANTADRDLAVTLAGTLTGAGGEPVGELRHESLRVPAGGQRTFALVDKARRARPEAVSADVRIAGAMEIDYAPPVDVKNGHVYRDGDRVVVTGEVVNTADRRVKVLVMASFYGADGAPIERPFTQLEIDGGQSYPVRFVGPEGSESAYVFTGPMAF